MRVLRNGVFVANNSTFAVYYTRNEGSSPGRLRSILDRVIAEPGFGRFGFGRFGLDRFGLDRFGLDRSARTGSGNCGC